jgi:hypothetical protein
MVAASVAFVLVVVAVALIFASGVALVLIFLSCLYDTRLASQSKVAPKSLKSSEKLRQEVMNKQIIFTSK